jgi:hypothetical protein
MLSRYCEIGLQKALKMHDMSCLNHFLRPEKCIHLHLSLNSVFRGNQKMIILLVRMLLILTEFPIQWVSRRAYLRSLVTVSGETPPCLLSVSPKTGVLPVAAWNNSFWAGN